VRSACPIAGVPAGTGDITLFNPPGSTDSTAIDVTAAITDVRATCQDAGSDVVSTITFTVVGLRRAPGPARQVMLPYFDVALRGGTEVAAKQVGQAVLNFTAGDVHAWARVQASVRVNRAAATLPANVRQILTRPRKAGEAEAAVDPMSDPAVAKAVANATFEHLVGFELTQDQIKYNATR
jgi:alkylated DNA nucleotide flippase Atl1